MSIYKLASQLHQSIPTAKIYLVGGCVRDTLLGVEPKDEDILIVGATVQAMIDAGYQQVGKDFPVFLATIDNKQYEIALARRERKTAAGYSGFSCDVAGVTLIEDLMRRDFTINALAQEILKDCLGRVESLPSGLYDLKNRELHPCSEAFSEDPLRVLRLARFVARGFICGPEMLAMAKQVARELASVSGDRIGTEFIKILKEKSPMFGIDVLRQCGALDIIFPELSRLSGVPQPAEHHPEIDTYIHMQMVMSYICQETDDPIVRFGALVHDLGKGMTPKALWPKHHKHEEAGIDLVKGVCACMRLPKEYEKMGCLASEFHTHIHRAPAMKAGTIVQFLKEIRAIQQPEMLEALILISEADARGRLGKLEDKVPGGEIMRKALDAMRSVDAQSLTERFKGKPEVIGQCILGAQIEAVKAALKTS